MAKKHPGPIALDNDPDGPKRTLAQWCRHFQIPYHTVYNRLKRGMPLSRALQQRREEKKLISQGRVVS